MSALFYRSADFPNESISLHICITLLPEQPAARCQEVPGSRRYDFELFSDTDAIPKSYVHVIEDGIRSYIDSEIARVYRIDFIDGGTTSQL